MVQRSTAAQTIILGIALLAGGVYAPSQTVTAVPKLDLNRFAGVWYEVARIPNKREKRCAGNVQMLVALGDKANHIQTVTACKTKAGYADATNADGKAQDKLGDGKLKLGTWPFTRKVWVLAIELDYQWALAGSPNHKELWIYSRKPNLSSTVIADLRAKAAAQGFAPDKLVTTLQGMQ